MTPKAGAAPMPSMRSSSLQKAFKNLEPLSLVNGATAAFGEPGVQACKLRSENSSALEQATVASLPHQYRLRRGIHNCGTLSGRVMSYAYSYGSY